MVAITELFEGALAHGATPQTIAQELGVQLVVLSEFRFEFAISENLLFVRAGTLAQTAERAWAGLLSIACQKRQILLSTHQRASILRRLVAFRPQKVSGVFTVKTGT